MVLKISGSRLFKLALILFFNLIAISLFAKKNEIFSGDTTLYLEELSNYLKTLPEQYEDVPEKFIEAWKEDKLFNPSEQYDIIILSQLMIKRNTKPYPHFYNFLSCMIAFKEYNTSESNYLNWVESFEKILDKRKTKTSQINSILKFTNVLLSENLIYRSSSTTWKIGNGSYKISNDKDLSVEFTDVDLICYAKRDSMHLYNTNGVAYPMDMLWKGSGGLVTWERGGYSRDDVFAHIKDYQIELKKSEYFAEDVTFTNKLYFDEPLQGVLHDKVKFNKNPDQATYPKFDSYTKEYIIEDLYENIDYEGGLSMQGAKLVGTGTIEKTAKLKIYRNDTLVLSASSLYFGFRSDRVSSLRTSVSIKLRTDSIYHPDLFFTYRVKIKELTLLKTDNYSSQGPYSNSYHKVDMNFEQLTWRMDEDVMRFTAPRGAAIGNAYFESVNYFNYTKFMNMMMMDIAHPLVSLKSFATSLSSTIKK
jgi:hypothetical protein